MSLRSENTQLRDEVHSLLGQFRNRDGERRSQIQHLIGDFEKADRKIHADNEHLRQQARQFVAQCHAATEELKAQVAAWRAATREFVWGNGGPRAKGKHAAGSEPEEAPTPRTRKARKKKAK